MVQGNVARSEAAVDPEMGLAHPQEISHWEAANYFFYAAAQRMSLNPEFVALLSRPYREIHVEVPLRASAFMAGVDLVARRSRCAAASKPSIGSPGRGSIAVGSCVETAIGTL